MSRDTVVRTIEARCKRCHRCVAGCPARAVRLEGGRAVVVGRRCVACGSCLWVCPHHAKRVANAIEPLRRLLTSDRAVLAALDPAFPAAFAGARPGQVVTALLRLGFSGVAEVAAGAELVGHEYARLARDPTRPLTIASHCSAVVQYVEKHRPELIPYLAPVASPAVVLARALKAADPAVAVVAVGPCVARKAEAREPDAAGALDQVLTFEELRCLLARADIRPAELPDSDFTGPRPTVGRVFAISGGPIQVAGFQANPLQDDVVVVEGPDVCLAALHELATGQLKARFVEARFCRGCIDGPTMGSGPSLPARAAAVSAYARAALDSSAWTGERLPTGRRAKPAGYGPLDSGGWAGERLPAVDLSRQFSPRPARLPAPPEDEVDRALRRIGRIEAARLDCGACGFPTCREHAIAACQGRAELEACLPYLLEQRQTSLRDEVVRARFVATIVHDMRAPLSAIRAQLTGAERLGAEAREDVAASVERIDALLALVNDLLDLTRVQAGEIARDVTSVDLGELVHGVVCFQGVVGLVRGITVEEDLPTNLPSIEADREDLVRLFTNLLSNAIKYNRPGGRVRVKAIAEAQAVRVEVADTGLGIAPEHLPRLYDEFYRVRTEETRDIPGSGLGLAIVRRIADAYGATVTVESRPGVGTTFTVRWPIISTSLPRLERRG